MVLGMQLQLLNCLKCQTALVATVFVNVAIRDGELWPFVMDLIEVCLENIGGFEDLITALFPAEETSCVISCRMLIFKRRLARFNYV